MSREREKIQTIMLILVNQFEYPEERITPHTDLFFDLNFSVLQFAELATYLEKEFEAKIFESYATSFTTVEHLADYMIMKMAGINKLNRTN